MNFRFFIIILSLFSFNLASSQTADTCTNLTSCNACLSSPNPCYWCIEENSCSSNVPSQCNTTASGSPSIGCPSFASISPINDEDIPWKIRHELPVAAGTSKQIEVKAKYFQGSIKSSTFTCRFNIDGRLTTVGAYYYKPYDEIGCDPVLFDYSESAPTKTASFEMISDGSKVIDNPSNVHVVMYKCRNMASDCSACQALDKRFGCGWCQDTNQCEIKNQCNGGSGKWLNKGQVCSTPSISSFSPQTGPWEGGTNVTIQGTNLGKSFEDVYSGVSVAGIHCEPYRHLYKPGKEIVCLLDSAGISESRSGPVSVQVDNIKDQSREQFTFVDPKIESISPNHGPLSGGTELTIKGKHLDAGNQAQVFIDYLPCQIITRNSAEIKCTTSASSKSLNGNVTVKFDRAVRTYRKDFFIYSDCIGHASCTTCVSSSTLCDWCADANYCTEDPAGNCRGDVSIAGVNRKSPGYLTGPNFCPQINSTQDGSSEIYIPSGVKKGVQVKVNIIGQLIVQTRFLCLINVQGNLHTLNARLLAGTIYCDPMEFQFAQAAPNTKATLSVVWGGSKTLDNPSNVHIVIYKCNEMAKSSDQCEALGTKYSCAWCPNSNSCEISDQCKQ